MKIVFVSNFYNHHQAFISKKFMSSDGVSFSFVSTTALPEEREKLGYKNAEDDFIILCDASNHKTVKKLLLSADVIISGSIKNIRLPLKKQLVFRYSERPFKKAPGALRIVKNTITAQINNRILRSPYLLCAGAYTSYDYSRLGLFKTKAYKWGYFPETKQYNTEDLFKKKDKTEILWCGRFLDWKHPDDAIQVAKLLKSKGKSFVLNIIGTGVMEDSLRDMIKKNDLEECVRLLGSMGPEEVRKYMEAAGIYLFTSDKQEGWGAVLNEAMNSGCAVVASHAIGSVPFLLKNGENGLVYKSGNIDELCEKADFLLEHPEEQLRLGEAAYRTITGEWNAEIAAERFINLAQHIMNGEKSPDLYESGPCSRAEIIKDE